LQYDLLEQSKTCAKH